MKHPCTISGNIERFVSISSDTSSANLDLASYFDMDTGTLTAHDFQLADIDTLSNVREGYSILVETGNNFNLVNSDNVLIPYSLRFDGGTQMPDSYSTSTASSNGQSILVSGSSTTFSGNTMNDGNLILRTTGANDLAIGDEEFSDEITLIIRAN